MNLVRNQWRPFAATELYVQCLYFVNLDKSEKTTTMDRETQKFLALILQKFLWLCVYNSQNNGR